MKKNYVMRGSIINTHNLMLELLNHGGWNGWNQQHEWGNVYKMLIRKPQREKTMWDIFKMNLLEISSKLCALDRTA